MTQQEAPRPPGTEIIYQEVKSRLDAQLHQVDTLDNKAGTVLSVGSLVMTIAAGLQVSFVDGSLRDLPLGLLIAGTVFYLLTMTFAFRGYWLRNFRRDPEPRSLRDKYLFETPDFTKRRIISNTIQSYEMNATLLESKVWNIKMAIITVAIQTVTLVSALVARGIQGVD